MLQDGRVPDGACTDLLDQGRPLAEAVERPKGNDLDEEGPGEQVPRKRIRIKAKTEKTDGVANPDEEVFTIQDERDHNSWRQFHPQQSLEQQHENLHLTERGVDQEIMVARLSIPVFEEDVFH